MDVEFPYMTSSYLGGNPDPHTFFEVYDDFPDQGGTIIAPTTVPGNVPWSWQFVVRIDPGDSQFILYFAFKDFAAPMFIEPKFQVINVRIISAIDTQNNTIGVGQNDCQRFLYEDEVGSCPQPNDGLTLCPANLPTQEVFQFDRIQAQVKIPHMGTEVLSESPYPNVENEYLWHAIYLRTGNVESTQGNYMLGGTRLTFATDLTIRLYQRDPAPASTAVPPFRQAEQGTDFELFYRDTVTGAQLPIPLLPTSPPIWELVVPAGNSVIFIGIQTKHDDHTTEGDGWEEVILHLGAPPGSGLDDSTLNGQPGPEAGWKNQLRFLIQDA